MIPVAFTAASCEETLFRGYALVELRRRSLPVMRAVVFRHFLVDASLVLSV